MKPGAKCSDQLTHFFFFFKETALKSDKEFVLFNLTDFFLGFRNIPNVEIVEFRNWL